MFEDSQQIERILSALGEHLKEMNALIPDLVVCGGSALNVMRLVRRTTKDVDIVAFAERNDHGNISLKKAEPLPSALIEAAKKVARDFNLPDHWLNPGPTPAVEFGLPEGLMTRVETKRFGKRLIIHFLSRHDQIFFKLYAAVDQGIGKHYNDLLALNPAAEELEEAARWCMTHDVSDGFGQSVKEMLQHMGHGDVAERL
jgi:hypothetical protein